MDEKLEKLYEDFNYPSIDKFYKILKDNGINILKMI
jgi:hypothetical protein